jgi:hypothetical protein
MVPALAGCVYFVIARAMWFNPLYEIPIQECSADRQIQGS